MFHKFACHTFVNRWQIPNIEVHGMTVRPLVLRAGIGMNSVGHDLLAKTMHFDRVLFESTKGLNCAVNECALGRPTDTQQRRIAK